MDFFQLAELIESLSGRLDDLLARDGRDRSDDPAPLLEERRHLLERLAVEYRRLSVDRQAEAETRLEQLRRQDARLRRGYEAALAVIGHRLRQTGSPPRADDAPPGPLCLDHLA